MSVCSRTQPSHEAAIGKASVSMNWRLSADKDNTFQKARTSYYKTKEDNPNFMESKAFPYI
jgi:hypothetical protein